CGTRLRHADSGHQASVDKHPLFASVGTGGTNTRMTFERKKDSDFSVPADVAIESFRSDARHDMRHVVQRERLADDVRIGGEMVLPVPVSQNHGRLGSRAEARAAKKRHAARLEGLKR